MIAIGALLWCAAGAWAAPGGAAPGDEAFVRSTGPVAAVPWWEQAGDAALAALVGEALDRNGDLDAARARVKMATGVQVQRLAPLLPQVRFDTTLNTGPYARSQCQSLDSIAGLAGLLDALANDPQSLLTNPPATGGGGGSDQKLCTSGSAMLVAGWQVDLFGTNALAYAAQAHEVAATRHDRDAQVLAMAAVVAEAWYDVRLAEGQVRLIEGQVEAQRALLELIELRYAEGSASGLDVLQQRQQVAATEALLPAARAARDARRRALAALVDRPPDALPDAAPDLPEPDGLPATGTPRELAASRPDLVALDRRARSARDARRSAQTALLPTLTLAANAGWLGFFDPDNRDNGLFDVLTQQPQWGAGATLSIPLFGGGAVHGRIRQARGAEAMAAASRDQAVRNAIAEVDGAIRLDQEQRARRDAVKVQASAARTAYDASVERYLAGLDPYVTVLSAQAASQAADLALLQARRDAISARIQLYTALGQVGR